MWKGNNGGIITLAIGFQLTAIIIIIMIIKKLVVRLNLNGGIKQRLLNI